MEIGTEAALFPEKEYVSGIFLAVYIPCNIAQISTPVVGSLNFVKKTVMQRPVGGVEEGTVVGGAVGRLREKGGRP